MASFSLLLRNGHVDKLSRGHVPHSILATFTDPEIRFATLDLYE